MRIDRGASLHAIASEMGGGQTLREAAGFLAYPRPCIARAGLATVCVCVRACVRACVMTHDSLPLGQVLEQPTSALSVCVCVRY